MLKTSKKNKLVFISILLVIVCGFIFCSTNFFQSKQMAEIQTIERTIEINRTAVDYQSILDEFEDSELETKGALTTFVGYKSIDLAELDGIDLVSDTDISDTKVNVKYNFSYDKETNIVTLSAELKDELGEIHIDTITGAAFINEDGEIDAVMNVDGEGILLSEMKNAGIIDNCGWFKRLIKKVVKVVAVVAVVSVVAAATAAVVVATAGAAAPALVAAGVGVVSTGITASAVAGTAIAAGAAAAAVTAGVGLGMAIGETVEEIKSADNNLSIGKEGIDKGSMDLIKNIAKTATIASLREMTRAYHVAFAVSQKFNENGTSYNAGDLYISKQSLTFDEAYAVLCAAGLINSIEDVTKNTDIINSVKNILARNQFGALVDLIKNYQNKGYFKNNRVGIYADSVEAAATLAVVTGAFINQVDIGLVGMGGTGGYYHFHDLNHNIHIWYGNRIV